MTLIYTSGGNGAVLPTDGDLVRFAPKGGARDLAGNVPHRDNPWVAITGDQELGVENPGVVSLGEDPYGIVRNDTITQVKLVTDISQSAQQIADSLGVQGSLVDFDIAKIMVEQTKDAVEKFDAFVKSRVGSETDYDTTIVGISEQEALTQLFNDIRVNLVDTSYGFSEQAINGILDGSITEDNYRSVVGEGDLELFAKMAEANI